MTLAKLLASSALGLWLISGSSFAAQLAKTDELTQSLSKQHKVVFATDCSEEDKVDGKCTKK
jgi:hypothetical protein